jgi:hypothetical protein
MLFADSETKFIKWYDYLWLLIPIAGIAIMVAVVLDRKARET